MQTSQKIFEEYGSCYDVLSKTVRFLFRELGNLDQSNGQLDQIKSILERQRKRWEYVQREINSAIIHVGRKNGKNTKSKKTKANLRTSKVKIQQNGHNSQFLQNFSQLQFPNISPQEDRYSTVSTNGHLKRSLAQSQSSSNKYNVDDGLVYREKLRKQFFDIKQFTTFVFAQQVEYEENYPMPKKVILNNYLQWKKQNNKELYLTDTAKIQMELTVRVKDLFPKAQSIKKRFIGIRFKQEFDDKNKLTDRAPDFSEVDFDFDNGEYFDPIGEIKKEVNINKGQNGNMEQTRPFNEFQTNKLDEQLGL